MPVLSRGYVVCIKKLNPSRSPCRNWLPDPYPNPGHFLFFVSDEAIRLHGGYLRFMNTDQGWRSEGYPEKTHQGQNTELFRLFNHVLENLCCGEGITERGVGQIETIRSFRTFKPVVSVSRTTKSVSRMGLLRSRWFQF